MVKAPNSSFVRAFLKGRSARLKGRLRTSNPYGKDTGWSRTFRAYWDRGWREADKEFCR